jgi:hypothetical protein
MSEGKYAGRDVLLALNKRRFTDVTLPSGDVVRIRNLSEKERSKYESETLTKGGQLNAAKLADAKRRLIALCCVDDAGNLIFHPDDIKGLESVDSAVTQVLYDEIRTHCGFDKEDIEELVKNSEAIGDVASQSS